MTPTEQPKTTSWRAAIQFLLASAIALAVAWRFDAAIARRLSAFNPSYSFDLYMMFRLIGFWPVWMLVGAAIALHDRGTPSGLRRAGTLWIAVTVAGVASEVLKLLIRRERPDALGTYAFRPWRDDPFATTGLGMPSGHASVAFAAVWVLSFFYPRATAVWLLLGVGCAFTRIAGNNHFASDIVASCVFSYAVAWGARELFRR